MTSLNHISLGDKISKKISSWILIFVTTIIIVLFFIAFLLSRQMFNKQISIWNSAAPQFALTNLIDSDYFSINREVAFVKSTELFSTFAITDNHKRVISKFGDNSFPNSDLRPVRDTAGVIWGYYYLKPDFYNFFSPFLHAAAILLVSILIIYFLIRWRIRKNLHSKFSRFNEFLNEIELVTEKLHEFNNQDKVFYTDPLVSFSSEQIIINRAISNLFNEIKKANKSLREAITLSEKKRFQDELTRTALQVTHDIGSPLAALEMIVQSTLLNISEVSRVEIRNAIRRIRDIANTLLKRAKYNLSEETEPLSEQPLHEIIEQIVNEKRMEFGSKINIETNISKSASKLRAFIQAGEFCRVLSNLLNNSIEASNDSNCQISISLFEAENQVVVQIEDQGKGIKKEIISGLGELGSTYDKPSGLGMGLSHAFTTIKKLNGNIDIQSKECQGTIINIYLPKVANIIKV